MYCFQFENTVIIVNCEMQWLIDQCAFIKENSHSIGQRLRYSVHYIFCFDRCREKILAVSRHKWRDEHALNSPDGELNGNELHLLAVFVNLASYVMASNVGGD